MAGGSNDKTGPRRLTVALRRAEAIKMRLAGRSYPDIAAALGYRSRGAAVQDIQRALAALTVEPAAELRALEVARLDDMWAAVLEVLRREHVTVSNGRVISLPDPQTGDLVPLRDDSPVLQAVDRLLKIQERRAKLLGLDAPTKVAVITDDVLDEELARTAAEVAELERAAAGEAGGAEEDPGEES